MTEEPELQQDAITTVREFFAAMELGAVAEAVRLLDPEIVWKNTSLPDVRGRDRVAALIRGLNRDWLGFSAEMHHIAAAGNVVLSDRTDVLRFGPVRIAFWVQGTFELRDGRIVLWHDHFSWANFLRGTLAGAYRAALRR